MKAATSNSLQDSFADLGVPLWDTTFCVVDLETTGSTEDDAITEFGAVKVRGGEVLGEFQTLVNPHTHIPPLVAVLTGITNQMVASAPPIDRVLPAFLEFARGTVLVAHNARFDVGFLRRNCAQLGYPWPKFGVLDTVALARHILLADEVPDCKLSTLARHFGTTVTPNHRALCDAQATVDVLHALIERVGNLGVGTYEELREFTLKVSPQRRSKRSWAKQLPEKPGVYFFVADNPIPGDPGPDGHGDRQILYVGKSSNLRRRVRSYFTASEKRPRMEEMIRVATGVEAYPCQTPLHAEVTELRMIAAHAPRYNRRSKFPERQHWLKITDEAFPRLSRVSQVRDDEATYFGPFSRRQHCEDVFDALYDAFPIRQCTQRLSATKRSPACALAGIGRCVAPCDGTTSAEDYAALVERVRITLTSDVRPACSALRRRLRRLVDEQRYEEAETVRRRLAGLLDAAARFHRVQSLAGCPQIVAARWQAPRWEIHVIRHGRLAAAGVALPGEIPQAVARALVTTAETVPAPIGPRSPGIIEETLRIATWLEQPGVRLIEIDGDWAWPLHAVLSHQQLVEELLGATPPSASGPTPTAFDNPGTSAVG